MPKTIAMCSALACVIGCYDARSLTDASTPDDAAIADAMTHVDGDSHDGATDATDAGPLPEDGGVADAADAGSHPPDAGAPWLCAPDLAHTRIVNASLYVDDDSAAVLLLRPESMNRRLYRGTLGSPLARWSVTEVNGSRVESCANCPVYELGDGDCGLRRLSETESICEVAIRGAQLTALSPTLAFAAYGGRVLRFDGTDWKQIGTHQPSTGLTRAIWSDGIDVVLAGSTGTVLGRADVAFHPMSGPLPGVTLSIEVAGPSVTDLWWTGNGELWHFDGSTWSRVWKSQCRNKTNGLVHLDDRVVFWGESYVGSVPIGSTSPTVDVDCGTARDFVAGSRGPRGEAILVAVEETPTACGSVSFWRSKVNGLSPL